MRKLYQCLILIALLTSIVGGVKGQASADLLARINSLRGSLGLAPYQLNASLNAAAANHAQWMASTQQISHYQSDGSTPRTRAVAAGYPSSWVSENIYGGTNASVDRAWNFWINSSIHYRGLTNPNYDHIGIGTASGNGINTYVLVFGNSSGTVSVNTGSGNSGNAGSIAAPSFIVGYDESGNIMHEVQPDQTLGDIALIYGYTWDDVPRLLELNSLTENDIRLLKIGSVFLVPPYDSTPVPTNTPEDYIPPTLHPDQIVQTALAQAEIRKTAEQATNQASVLLTPIYTATTTEASANEAIEPTSTQQSQQRSIATSNSVPMQLVDTITPSPMATSTETPTPATLVASLVDNDTQTPVLETSVVSPGQNGGFSPILIIAVALQVIIVIGAGVEIFRRLKR